MRSTTSTELVLYRPASPTLALDWSDSTAARWFVTDQVYLARAADYAFPRQSATDVHQSAMFHDSSFNDCENWYNLVFQARHLYFAKQDHLVFADVTGTKTHKRMVKTSGCLLREEHTNLSAEQIKINAEMANLFREKDSITINEFYRDVNCRGYNVSTDQDALECYLRTGKQLPTPDFVDYILRLPSAKQQVDALAILSGEIYKQYPRPCLILIGIFDEYLSVVIAESSGWAMAYDFISGLIIVKRWKSDHENRHPLQDPWFGPIEEDGICWVGTPSSLAQTILDTDFPEEQDHLKDGYKLVTRNVLMRWMLKHKEALCDAGSPIFGEADKMQILGDKMHQETRRLLKMPFLPKKRMVSEGVKWEAQLDCYYTILMRLRTSDKHFRSAALKEMSVGRKKNAEDLAILVETVKGMARTLLDEPSGDFACCE
ncbi:hypothetical protein MMC24_007057 [Lignoscripta atroalba]|nr:hypothetical protein [Lignoscripta atroalba]